jgi:hypothetical protein
VVGAASIIAKNVRDLLLADWTFPEAGKIIGFDKVIVKKRAYLIALFYHSGSGSGLGFWIRLPRR